MNISSMGMADALKTIKQMVANDVPKEHTMDLLNSLIRLLQTLDRPGAQIKVEPKPVGPDNVVPFRPKGRR